MYVCVCKAVKKQQIQEAVEQGQSYAQIRKSLGVATDCGCCGKVAKDAVRECSDNLSGCASPCEYAAVG